MTDEETVVYLNQSGEKSSNKREIIRGKGPEKSWAERHRSRPITLDRGKKYYFEFVHKEGTGEDFSAVGWTLPSGRVERPIPGKYFSAPNFKEAPSFPELLANMEKELLQKG